MFENAKKHVAVCNKFEKKNKYFKKTKRVK